MLYKDAILCPSNNTGISKNYDPNNHRGVDFGWLSWEDNHPVYAIDDGFCNLCEDYLHGGERGEYIVLVHEREGQKRYSAYLHLKEGSIMIKTGDSVKRGQVIGYMGNTGKSNGKHLHLYVSKYTDINERFTYERMKELCNFDPKPYLVRDKAHVWTLSNYSLSNLPYLEDLITDEREELKRKIDLLTTENKQLKEKIEKIKEIL